MFNCGGLRCLQRRDAGVGFYCGRFAVSSQNSVLEGLKSSGLSIPDLNPHSLTRAVLKAQAYFFQMLPRDGLSQRNASMRHTPTNPKTSERPVWLSQKIDLK